MVLVWVFKSQSNITDLPVLCTLASARLLEAVWERDRTLPTMRSVSVTNQETQCVLDSTCYDTTGRHKRKVQLKFSPFRRFQCPLLVFRHQSLQRDRKNMRKHRATVCLEPCIMPDPGLPFLHAGYMCLGPLPVLKQAQNGVYLATGQ